MDLTKYETCVTTFFQDPASTFEKVQCLFCDQRSWVLFTKGTMEIRQCACGFVWNANQPTKETLDQFYKESQAMTEWSRFKQTPVEDDRQRNKYGYAVDFLKHRVISLLDVGCGNGKFLSLMGFGTGIDSNEAAINLAKGQNLNVSNLPLSTMGSFDAVTLWGVLEHMKDPLGVLTECVGHLNPGGYLVVCVPNVKSSVVRALKQDCFTFCPQHLWYFDKQTVKLVIEQTHLRIVDQYTVEPEHLPIVKQLAGYSPYDDGFPSRPISYETSRLISSLEEFIVASSLGYKVVTIAQK